MKIKLGRNAKGKAQVAKLPMKLGDIIDLAGGLKLERLALSRQIDDLKDAETHIKTLLMKTYGKDKLNSAAGRKCKVNLHPKSIPQVKDWRKFTAYLLKNKATDLLQRRLNETAINERYQKGKTIPGIDFFKFTAISIVPIKERKRKS